MSEVLDRIECHAQMLDELVYRIPSRGQGCFRVGSRLIVREGQVAVLFRDGRALDVFGVGEHTIAVNNIPLLVDAIGEAFDADLPLRAEVYYVSTREFIDHGWGTRNPILVECPRLGLVPVVSNGLFSFAVGDPKRLIEKVGQPVYRREVIHDYLRERLTSSLSQILGSLCSKSKKPLLEIISEHKSIAAKMLSKTQKDATARGITLRQVHVSWLSPPNASREELLAREQERMRIQAASVERMGEIKELLQAQQRDIQELKDALQQAQQATRRYGFAFRLLLGILSAVTGIAATFILPSALSWQWLITHPRRLGLQAGISLGVLGVSWAIVDPDRKRRWFALGSIAVAAIIALIQYFRIS